MSPEERHFPIELKQRADAVEVVVAQILMGELDPTDAVLVGLLKSVQKIGRLARWVAE